MKAKFHLHWSASIRWLHRRAENIRFIAKYDQSDCQIEAMLIYATWQFVHEIGYWKHLQTHRAVVVDQLVERLLPIPEVHGSNPVIGRKYIEQLFSVNCWQWWEEDKRKKMPEKTIYWLIAHLAAKSFSLKYRLFERRSTERLAKYIFEEGPWSSGQRARLMSDNLSSIPAEVYYFL